MSRLPLLTAGLVLLVAGPAHASTARVAENRVLYAAAAGERNALTTQASPGTLVLRDAGAAITPGDGCEAVDGGVLCRVSNALGLPPVLDAYLGDGDDSYKGTSQFDNVRGGSGRDTLSGNGRLWGGPGNDVVESTSYIHDDDGKVPAKDVYRGGGQTVLSYENRTTGVRVDLRRGRASEDVISGMRSVRGSRSSDVLIGDDGPNELVGGGGHDRIQGLGGDDRISSATGTADIDCGAGRDSVATGRGGGVTGCETVNGAKLTPTLRTPGGVFLTAAQPNEGWAAKAGGRTVARLQAKRLRLNAAGRRLLLRREGTLTVRVTRTVSARALDAFTVELRLR